MGGWGPPPSIRPTRKLFELMETVPVQSQAEQVCRGGSTWGLSEQPVLTVSHQMLGKWHPARWPLLVPFSPPPSSWQPWISLKFTLATAGSSLSPLHDFAVNLLPRLCCEHCVLGAHGPASPILPSLGSDLYLSSGLQTSSAVSGLVTLRMPFTSTILPHSSQFILHTNLSLGPKGAQGPPRACPLLVQWSLVMRVHARLTPVTQAVSRSLASPAPLLPVPHLWL